MNERFHAMILSRIMLILALFTGPVTTLRSQDVPWGEETGLLFSELVQRHPGPFFRIDSASFHRKLESVAETAGESTIFDVSVRLQQVVATLGDPNTRINFHYNVEPKSILPITLYWFEEGLMVMETQARYKALLGKRVTGINHTPVGTIADSLYTLFPEGYEQLFREESPQMFTWTQLLDHFGFGGTGTYRVECEDTHGNTVSVTLPVPVTAEEPVMVKPRELPLGWRDRKSYFWDQYDSENRLYYIQYNKCWSREAEEEYGSGASALFMPSFREFEKNVLQNLRKVPVDKLVLDLRFNDGGHPVQGTDFFAKLIKARFSGQARFFLIIGRNTRDAGLINAVEYIQLTNAVVAGEPTGGKPNHFGEIEHFILPGSNLIVDCSTRYFHLMDGDPETLRPDLQAPMTFGDYMSGKDPAIEAIREYEPVAGEIR